MADFVKNADRAERARGILEAYGKLVGQADEPVETNMGDLVADFMHLCEVESLDWEEIERMGQVHFEEEQEDEAQAS